MLYAPWRSKYILSNKEEGCFLCKLGKEGNVLYKGKNAFIVVNKYPYTYGHVLVAPYRHVGNLEELTSEERAELLELATLYISIMKKKEKPPHGFNLGINIGKVAGAGLPDHIHLHIVPRWEGDHNFMDTIAGERVFSFSIESMEEDLQKLFKTFVEK